MTGGGSRDGRELTADEAAPRLGAEIIRLNRLLAAFKQRAKHEPGRGDRIILYRLAVDGEQRATDLSAETFLTLSTVSREVRSLVDRGLVERRPDPEDGRGALLAVTPAGMSAFESYRRQRDEELGALLEPWPAEDRGHVTRLLGRLNDDLAAEYARTSTAPPASAGRATTRHGEKTE
jgi:DNA-binding MarR family transcriptional regulator